MTFKIRPMRIESIAQKFKDRNNSLMTSSDVRTPVVPFNFVTRLGLTGFGNEGYRFHTTQANACAGGKQ